VKSDLKNVGARVEARVGKIAVTGRYHRHPKKLTNDYRLSSKVLGSGYNGQVTLAKAISGDQEVAVKGFKLHGVSKEKKKELESECEIFLAMDHPHVARLVDVYESDDMLYLVMECMKGGELFKRVVDQKRFSEKDAADATWQMLLAVAYIHSHGIVHRDIKLENWLYEAPTSNHLKLIDFGFSKIWSPNTKMAASCGTLAYVAPEVLSQSYTSQCDLWSLGVTVFIVLFGYMPFYGSEDNQVRNIKAGRYKEKPEVWGKVSKSAQSFVKGLLVVDPSKRLTAEQALKHDWIQEREKLEAGSLDQGIVDAMCSFAKATQFRKACMSMMAWSLTNEERAKVRKAFIEMDTNRTGAITLAEFKKVLESKFQLNDDEIAQTFKSLDMDGTQEIHYSEFLAAMVSSRIKLHDDLLLATFKRFDTDDSGYITKENLLEVLGESFDGAEVDDLMREADFSNDGKISYQEFIEYLKQEGTAQHEEAAARVIDNAVAKEGREKKLALRSPMNQKGAKENTDKEGVQGCHCVMS